MAFEKPQGSATTAKPNTQETVQELEGFALELRKSLLKLCSKAGMLHLGGDLSVADIMIALWKYKLTYDPARPRWEGRNRFILSKGHAAGALYIAQALAGCYELQTVFDDYLRPGKDFGVHPGNHTPSIEIATGSLGHGLSIAVGVAKALRFKKSPSRVFCVMGDGETQEGSIWEAAMAAAHFKLGNLVAIIDRNGFCLDGPTEEIMHLEPFADKWRAFGWHVTEIDGNDMAPIVEALDCLADTATQQPQLIIARTTKGFGISFMENNPEWHAGSVNAEMLPQCLAELDARLRKERSPVMGGFTKVGFTWNMPMISPQDRFGEELVRIGKEHQNVVVLSADLTRSMKTGQFLEAIPERYINTGIAEANMMGIAAGLALEGFMPFTSTFAQFAAMRDCEQVRTDICYPNLPVRIVGRTPGFQRAAVQLITRKRIRAPSTSGSDERPCKRFTIRNTIS